MVNSGLAEPLRRGRGAAAGEHIVIQRPFRTPDQRGGAVTMWANLTRLWVVVDLEPPRQAWPCQIGKGVAVWVAGDYRAGIGPGLRVLLRGEAFVIDEVVCLHGYQPMMWLRVMATDVPLCRNVA